MADEPTVKSLLDELATDPDAVASRSGVCEAIADALVHLGRLYWVTGAIVGPDRASRASPFGFGSDEAVGVATALQIGGELAAGAVQLLRTGNKYAASALIRQLVEVEYLTYVFLGDRDTAGEWLRADRAARRQFWSPAQLRKRAGDVFLPSDYWQHCDRGGHPTTEALSLLPDHAGFGIDYIWVDLAGHLASIWANVEKLSARLLNGSIPADWNLSDVDGTIKAWRDTDGLHAALSDLTRNIRSSDKAD